MLSGLLAGVFGHQGLPPAPHDVWATWHPDPVVLVLVLGAIVGYERGRRSGDDHPPSRLAFHAGMAVVAFALLSPLDTVSGALASAHMIQHVLLLAVAAPLLAWSAPGPQLQRGLPTIVGRRLHDVRRRVGLGPARLRAGRAPVGRWLGYVAVVWLWHASVLYGAAVRHDLVHAIEHATFLGAAWLVWSSILGPRRVRVAPELGLLGVFTLGLQGVFLSVLLTFATGPWYDVYADSTASWGLTPLEDQHLAGVIMWVPVGLVHTGIGIAILMRWLHSLDRAAPAVTAP